MLRRVTLRRQTFAVAALLAAALACWMVAFRGMSMMGGFGPFLGVWVTAMAAMMLPSAVPMVAAYTGIGRERASTPAFLLGYLAVWTTYGIAAYVVGLELPNWSWLAGAGLLLAGLYQLTPLKNACLRQCRAPLGFVLRRWRDGPPQRARPSRPPSPAPHSPAPRAPGLGLPGRAARPGRARRAWRASCTRRRRPCRCR